MREPFTGSATLADPIARLIGVAAAVLLVAAAVTPASAADPEAGRRKSAACAGCHGADGNAAIPGTPSLAGQPAIFAHWQLIKYRDGRRKHAEMAAAAAKLSDEDMADLAAFYAAQKPRRRAATTDPRKVAEGRQAAVYYHCTSCHRPDLSGHEQAPRLAGQDLEYTRKLLRSFKDKTASDLDGMMTMSAQPLRDEDIELLAHYIASLGQ